MKNNSFKKFKIVKVISVLLCFVLILAANFTALAGSLTATEFEKKLQEVKELYPQGTQQEEWKVNGSVVGWSCHGYARWISHYVWGVDFANGNGTGWQLYYATATTTPLDRLVPGDVLRYRTKPTSNSNHTIFITRVEDDLVYFTDCNSDGYNTIKWDRVLSKSTLAEYLKRTLANLGTYGYICHYNPNTLSKINSVNISYNVNGGELAGSGETVTKYTVVDSSGINLRSTAGTSGSRVGALPMGAVFTVSETAVADGYTWGKTVYNGVTGWCVISEDWTTSETVSVEPYYVDSTGTVMLSDSKSTYYQTMLMGNTYEKGFAKAEDFGLTKKGFTFLGWSTSKTGGVLANSGGAITPETVFPEVKNGSIDVTLYAVWQSDVVLSGIEVASLPTKTKYLLNAPFDSSGLKIKLKYSNNTSKIITDGFTLKGFSSTTAGDKTITVEYEGKTTTFKLLIQDLKTGDINRDLNIDLLDVTLLAQCVADWDIQCDRTALDVNDDSTVNLIDIVHLARYVAGWEGIELK